MNQAVFKPVIINNEYLVDNDKTVAPKSFT